MVHLNVKKFLQKGMIFLLFQKDIEGGKRNIAQIENVHSIGRLKEIGLNSGDGMITFFTLDGVNILIYQRENLHYERIKKFNYTAK